MYPSCYEQSDLENELIEYHQQHFSQATNTPFAQKEVFRRLGYAADTDYADAFYQGDNTELQYWPEGKVKTLLTAL